MSVAAELTERKAVRIRREKAEIAGYIKKFFRSEWWWMGGRVPEAVLLSDRNLRIVRNIDLIDAVDIGYAALERTEELARTDKSPNVDIKLCMRVLRKCERLEIPQNYIGGMFLLYLDLCEKVVLL